MNKKKNLAQSIKAKLGNIGREEKMPLKNIYISFFIERMVARIVTAKASKDLVFKGGFVGLNAYNSNRYTLDLDASLLRNKGNDSLKEFKYAIESDLDDGVWFQFDDEKDLRNEFGGTTQIYRVGLGEKPKNTDKALMIHFDIGFDKSTVPSPIKSKLNLLLENEEISWKIYPVETIIAEKFHAFLERESVGGSSRAKDLYDLSIYLPKANKAKLAKALHSCFSKRKRDLPDSLFKTMQNYDYTRIKSSWHKVTRAMSKNIEFKDSLDTFLKSLEKIGPKIDRNIAELDSSRGR